ncbi:MAG: MFS transporter [Candidatus Azobacteroides sp.]|nr:MFS transporter [Candidatus Azobacteroides sp.]
MKNWKKVFAIIWTGQFASILTSSVVNFAIILWLSIETGSAGMLALAAIAALLPQSVLGFFTGVFVDRYNRKIIMILSDSFIAICTLVMVILFYTGNIETWHIFLLMGLRSVGSAFHMPAMQASVPLLAPEGELVRVAGINQMIQSISNIAGPALGALLITLFPIGKVLILDIAGAAFACITLLFVKIPDPVKKEDEERNAWKEIKEGITIITTQKGLNLLFLFSIISTFFIVPVSVLFPLMTLNHFQGNAFQVSLVEIVWSVGSLIGGGLLSIRKHRFNKAALINFSYLILGASFLFSGLLSPQAFALFVLLTTLAGVARAFYYSSFTALVQEKIEPAMLGRVFSTFMSFSILPSMLGLLGTGYISDHIGLTSGFIIAGCIVTFVGILSFFIKSIMNLDKRR